MSHTQWVPQLSSEPSTLPSSLRRKEGHARFLIPGEPMQGEQETAEGHTLSPRVELDAKPLGYPALFSLPGYT